MAQPLLLKNGRLIDPANNIDGPGHLLIEDGRIKGVYLGDLDTISEETCQVIDAKGKWIVPGLVDMHVHLREPGQEYKETVESGTRAAAAGGFTAVACMPNTSPANDNEAVTSFILTKAKEAGFAKVYPVASISHHSDGTRLAEFGELKKAGAAALSDDGRPVENSQLMRRALEYSANYDLLLISHSEEMALSGNGVMNEGAFATRLGLRGIPSIAEEIMIYRDLALAEYIKRPIHIAHISTRESVDLIRRAKGKGSPVTAETAPHYFTLTEEAVGDYNTAAKMNPPLRSKDDRLAIQEGLQDGTIDVIATDHAPHARQDKEVEFDLAANGIIGLETSVPLALALVRDEIITPARMIELMSVNPCRILGVEGGSLSPGACADITLIDPHRVFTYEEKAVVSKSKNSPFLNWSLQGKAVTTILAGRITYSDPDPA
ncbi:MAG: dihydroorotase [Desulfurivibrionaceae bacterium]|nr:dihydroorotase [Desulfurivibrionaceae bacterium]